MKNFTSAGASLVAAMAKIDNSYYPEVLEFLNLHLISPSLHTFRIVASYILFLQTLHRMYIVNAGTGFKKMLWPAAQKFLDAKTIAKIHVQALNLVNILFGQLLPCVVLSYSAAAAGARTQIFIQITRSH